MQSECGDLQPLNELLLYAVYGENEVVSNAQQATMARHSASEEHLGANSDIQLFSSSVATKRSEAF